MDSHESDDPDEDRLLLEESRSFSELADFSASEDSGVNLSRPLSRITLIDSEMQKILGPAN